MCTDCVKDIGVTLDSKLYFHQHVNFTVTHTLNLIERVL